MRAQVSHDVNPATVHLHLHDGDGFGLEAVNADKPNAYYRLSIGEATVYLRPDHLPLLAQVGQVAAELDDHADDAEIARQVQGDTP